ncbi:hypothetical protein ACN38_g331 [Penicillium nordicum]|uniref:Uncharacterized protein n=1 Tax=Penicillium nordicum TaxID=229535 RepID=A0A0M8PDC0_9EURO|nr:hypothetical protein ACN38_g331 [Penicillium nordicum]
MGGKSKNQSHGPKKRAKIRRRNTEQKQRKKKEKERKKKKKKSQNEKNECNNTRLGAWRSPDSLRYQSGASLYYAGFHFFIRAPSGLGFSPWGYLQHIFLVKMSSATSDIHF